MRPVCMAYTAKVRLERDIWFIQKVSTGNPELIDQDMSSIWIAGPHRPQIPRYVDTPIGAQAMEVGGGGAGRRGG